jgi:hypothetical protein
LRLSCQHIKDEMTEDNSLNVKIDLTNNPEQVVLGYDTQVHADEIEYGDTGNSIENIQAPYFDLPETHETAEEDIIDN